jgi:hypothetical protein
MSAAKTHTMKDQIVARIERLAPGKAFMAKDFLDIASRGSVDMALGSLTRAGAIRRIQRGLYDLPKVAAALGGELSPDIDEAARALARRHRWTIIPDGPWAANLLGLSTQVPAKIVYLSDGPSKKLAIGRRSIQFKHARPQALAGADHKSALVVQALRHLGKDGIDNKTLSILKNSLSDADRMQLLKNTRLGVDWIYEMAKKIAEVHS